MKREAEFAFQKHRSLVPEAIYYVAGTAAVVIVDLAARPFQEAVVIQGLQPPQ